MSELLSKLQSFGSAVGQAPQNAKRAVDNFMAIPGRADNIAEEMFPDDARDSSRKNAFRHALGTGMVTQRLGNNWLSGKAAETLGLGWEFMGANRFIRDADHREDTFHDLLANRAGRITALDSETEAELIEKLANLANESQNRPAPRFWYGREAQMTHTVE